MEKDGIVLFNGPDAVRKEVAIFTFFIFLSLGDVGLKERLSNHFQISSS